ncbi:MAG: hypothetical protein GY859_17100 [Desulfobacterales bacterium]|nr:hypothetical protein [Desulfobacterales bacterium]
MRPAACFSFISILIFLVSQNAYTSTTPAATPPSPPVKRILIRHSTNGDWLADHPRDNVAVFESFNALTSGGGDGSANDAGWEQGNHHRGQGSGGRPRRQAGEAGVDPVADVRVNGSDAAVTIRQGEALTLSLSMNAGSYEGRNSDWWLVYQATTDAAVETLSYVIPAGWTPGVSRLIEAPLATFQDITLPLNLSEGVYTICLGADGAPDGQINAPIWYDCAGVTVQPPRETAPGRIQPEDLRYIGAFRLPDSPGTSEAVGWEWSNWASAATYYPSGDPVGQNDGYPGSLFAVGHDHTQYVSEISIPAPVISLAKDVSELNTATTLQPFQDIKGGLYGELELPRVGLEYLPAQAGQTEGKLHFCWAPHLDEPNNGPTHGWCGLDLSNPGSAGVWAIGGYQNYLTTDYIFEIPGAWADLYTPGKLLAAGRYRDGGQAAQGPSLFAYGPWNEGNPPASGTTISTVPLLLYSAFGEVQQGILDGGHHTDEWNGGAWLTAGEKSAVIFVGSKGTGDNWYGCSNGVVWPEEPPYPPECDDRGWWSTGIEGRIIFYDPADLAAVAQGQMQPWSPLPYAVMNIDNQLYGIDSTRQKHHVSAAAFDREHGLLFIFEPYGDGDKPLVHVWEVGEASSDSR